MAADRSKRAILALLLALLAAVGMGLIATGATRVGDSPAVGLALIAVGAAFVASSFRWLRSINGRSAPPER